MARGVTDQDVFEAADGLLARGDRPTIERVRQALGRGSPNTVNRHLDAWWSSLSRRMQGPGAQASALPPVLLELCGRLIAGMRQQAHSEIQEALRMREEELETQRRALTEGQAANARAAEQFGVEFASLRSRNEALATECAQLKAEVDRQSTAANDAEATARSARVALESAQVSHLSEVRKIRHQSEGNETRWLREIDHLRDDAKRLRTEQAEITNGLRAQLKELERRLSESAKERARLEADLAQQREARVAAEAAGRATDALLKNLTSRPPRKRNRARLEVKAKAIGRKPGSRTFQSKKPPKT